ncbi:hypothetical protein [Paracoccus sp. IB05]|uniref:hypothetical protein n=1 Tax=Paracoccus sp. IB05 TaxID=2779367 RepID=UPI0018E8B4B7|nr:hypothetical protein [Paracoccus sp. IB05]MBJ2149332.1 hypothetical protein [Paracoccus sp. IB05]
MISLISSLRSLKVLGLHPRDSDADDLVKRLKRIGRNVGALWPWPENLPTGGDVVFVEVKEVAPRVWPGCLSRGPDCYAKALTGRSGCSARF